MTLLAACGRRPDDVPVQVSVIDARGGSERDGPTSRILRLATAQGLVRFDATGGIEPALAERWIVIDDGRSFIFRLGDATWPDGRTVTAADIVPVLRRAVTGSRRHDLSPYLTAVDRIVAMTPQVIEVRLKSPRPDLLKLFAQPELAVPAPRESVGSGPFRIAGTAPSGMLLRPIDETPAGNEDAPADPEPEDFVRVRGERASAAVLRFVAGRSDLVTGGTLVDWPIATTAGVPPVNLRVDAAAGLFGLAVVNRAGVLATPRGRAAVAMAIDRTALTAAFREDWAPAETLLPDRFDSSAMPAPSAWVGVADADRVAAAGTQIAQIRGTDPEPPLLRIAMPAGPGANLMFGSLAAAFGRVGLRAVRVGMGDAADLALVDRVAPYDSARWYLRSACQPCAAPVAALIAAARDAPDLATRAALIARADAALAADVAFIPIARPLRWSLVARRLRNWTPNARAIHPLNALRRPPTS